MTLSFNTMYSPVDGPWLTVSFKGPEPQLLLLQNDGGHLGAIGDGELFLQHDDTRGSETVVTQAQPKEETPILRECTPVPETTDNLAVGAIIGILQPQTIYPHLT